MDKKISVIVANYNHEKYIEAAVKSILNQTYENFEIVIVDDCSTDNSKDAISDIIKLDKKRIVKPILLEKNTGKWNALNKAISERCSGHFITTQDADDASTPQRLEFTLRNLNENRSFHTLCGFSNCGTDAEVITSSKAMFEYESLVKMDHKEVVSNVYKGFKTPGVNHYYTGPYEVHGASALFHRQLWDYGMKFMPGNMGLRCQKAEDSDFNTSS